MRIFHTIFLSASLFLSGCVNTDNKLTAEAQPEHSTIPVAANRGPAETAVPAGGFSWNKLASIASQRTAESQMTALRIKRNRLENTLECTLRNPQIRLNSSSATEDEYSAGGSNSREDIQDYGVGLRFYINNPFVTRWMKKQATTNADTIMATANELSYATYCETKSSCLEVAILADRLNQIDHSIEIKQKICNRYKELTKKGYATPLRMLQARLKNSRLQMRKKKLEREHRNALFHLSLLTGIPVAKLEIQQLESATLPSPSELNADKLITNALQMRPDLESIRCAIRSARLDIEIAKARQIPWFEFVEGAISERKEDSTSYSNSGVSHSESNRDEWKLRTAISLPVFSWSGNETDVAKTALREIELRKTFNLSSLNNEITNAVENYLDAYNTHNHINKTTEKQIKNFNKTLKTIDRTKTVVKTEIMETEEQITSFRREARQSLYDCLRLKLMLESITGDRGKKQ